MVKYSLSQKALTDLRNIWNYTVETWSEEQATEDFTREDTSSFIGY